MNKAFKRRKLRAWDNSLAAYEGGDRFAYYLSYRRLVRVFHKEGGWTRFVDRVCYKVRSVYVWACLMFGLMEGKE